MFDKDRKDKLFQHIFEDEKTLEKKELNDKFFDKVTFVI